MSLREAAQQALEALDAYSWEQVDAARAALRTALAEPEKHEDWCASLTMMLTSLPPKPAPCNCKRTEPVQEPVAWRYQLQGQWIYTEVDPAEWREDPWPYENVQSLYTHLPQRKPLTDKEIDAVTIEQWGEMKGYPLAAHRAFARAIERAHGIGGEA